MYNVNGLQVNRGTYNSQAAGGDRVVVEHTYKTNDTLAQVIAPGYFPENFGLGDSQDIQIGDILLIVTSDSFDDVKITALSPAVTISTDGDNVFPDGITTTTINATSITTQTLNSTTSITTPQYFGVNMDLTGDITCANLTATAGTVLSPLVRTTPVTGVVLSANITATDIGTNTLTATNYINSLGYISANGDITSAGGNIITTVGNIQSQNNITSVAGTISGTMSTPSIKIGLGTNSLTYFDEFSATVPVTGPWASPINTFIKIQRYNQMIYYYIRGIPPAPATIADAMFIADGLIPMEFRPLILREVGPVITINNSAFQTSAVAIRGQFLGGILISGSLQNTTPFTGAGNAGFDDIHVFVSQN